MTQRVDRCWLGGSDMRVLNRLVTQLVIMTSCNVAVLRPDCRLAQNPYLKRSVADNLLIDVKNGRDNGKTAATILPELQKKVPLISCIAIKKNMFGQTIVELSLEQPWILLLSESQHPRVLARSGSVTPAYLIRDDVLSNLAAIFISKTADKTGQVTILADWLNRQPDKFFSRFLVTWHDKNDIEVHDETLPLVTIRATNETIFDDRVLKFLDLTREKERLYATIDLRFGGKQIVLVPKNSRGKIV